MSKVIDITGRIQRKKKPSTKRKRTKHPTPQQQLMQVPSLPPDFYSRGREQLDQRLIEEAERKITLYKKNPLKFFSNELHIPTTRWRRDCPPSTWKPRPYNPYPLWSKQREIIKALVEHKKVAVKSGHGVGKTFIAAGVTLYLAYVYHALGVTTAPTFRQVKRLLWGEIRDIYTTANQRGAKLGGKLLQTSLELGDKWFVEGFSTDHPEVNMPGYHEENVFAVVDEAGGVDPATYDMLETIMTSENSFVLLIGNPIDPKSPFADCFKPGSGWHCISISCYDSPNVRNKKNIYPKLASADWPERMKKKWGKDSPLYKSRVLAEFPKDTVDGLIPHGDIMKALERELPADRVMTFGVDIARQGSDRSVIGARYASGKFRILEQMEKKRETETSGRVVLLYNELKPDAINTDDIGVGGGVTDILYEQDLPVNGIVVSEAADETADELGKVKFWNKRSQYYWKLRQAFVDGEVDIDDDELANELSLIPVEYTGKGAIKIPEKDKIKAKLGRSPDLADAMMLAWSKDEADVEGELVRFL